MFGRFDRPPEAVLSAVDWADAGAGGVNQNAQATNARRTAVRTQYRLDLNIMDKLTFPNQQPAIRPACHLSVDIAVVIRSGRGDLLCLGKTGLNQVWIAVFQWADVVAELTQFFTRGDRPNTTLTMCVYDLVAGQHL